MSDFLDGLDQLHMARDLARLIGMTSARAPGDDGRAISAGCEAIEERFERAFALLEKCKPEVAE